MCELTHGVAGERHGKSMGATWARHAMCESALKLTLFRCVRKTAEGICYLHHVCLPARLPSRPPAGVEQLRSHWTDFHGILYLSIFRISATKVQVSLTFGENNGYVT